MKPAKTQAVTIILSEDNDSEIQTPQELMHFILNELESAGIGALLKIEEVTP